MIISLTGTPGTGKTTICGLIQSQYSEQYHVIDLNKLIIGEKLYTGKDERRDCYIADLEKLEGRVKQIIDKTPEGKDILMEGHLSHLLPADAIIVLRASPATLRERLIKKGYSSEKVKENVNAEALDVILVESVQKSSSVYEINTTDMTPQAIVQAIISIIESLKDRKIPAGFLPGKINWIDQVEL